jgi:hypothetical protein
VRVFRGQVATPQPAPLPRISAPADAAAFEPSGSRHRRVTSFLCRSTARGRSCVDLLHSCRRNVGGKRRQGCRDRALRLRRGSDRDGASARSGHSQRFQLRTLCGREENHTSSSVTPEPAGRTRLCGDVRRAYFDHGRPRNRDEGARLINVRTERAAILPGSGFAP